MVGAQEKRNVILYAQNEFKISDRRSCKLLVAPRIHQMLLRSGEVINHKRTERLYNELDLSLRRKNKKKRYKNELRILPPPPNNKNEIWAMDFVHDALSSGRKIKGLTIVDLFSKESPAIEINYSISGFAVIAVLQELKSLGKIPKDNQSR